MLAWTGAGAFFYNMNETNIKILDQKVKSASLSSNLANLLTLAILMMLYRKLNYGETETSRWGRTLKKRKLQTIRRLLNAKVLPGLLHTTAFRYDGSTDDRVRGNALCISCSSRDKVDL